MVISSSTIWASPGLGPTGGSWVYAAHMVASFTLIHLHAELDVSFEPWLHWVPKNKQKKTQQGNLDFLMLYDRHWKHDNTIKYLITYYCHTVSTVCCFSAKLSWVSDSEGSMWSTLRSNVEQFEKCNSHQVASSPITSSKNQSNIFLNRYARLTYKQMNIKLGANQDRNCFYHSNKTKHNFKQI